MSERPADWKLSQLRSAARPSPDSFADGDWIEAPYLASEGIRLIQTGNIGRASFLEKADSEKYISPASFRLLNCKWVKSGDLLVCRLADPIGRACEVPPEVGEAVTSVDCTIFRVESTRFDKRFVLHWLNSDENLKNAAGNAGGSTRSRISRSNLGRLPIPEPCLAEQERVGEILDTLDTAIHETEAIIAKLKAVKQGLLHDLLTRGIGANGELRPPQAEAPHLYKPSPLGWIPKQWDVRRLGECSTISSGVTLGRDVTGHGLVELPYLRVANVQDGYVDLGDIKTVRVLRSEIDRYALMDGDVLMNEGGDFDKLGRGTVWRAQINLCLHQNHVFRVRCNREMLSPDYLAAYSASQRGKAFFVLSSKQSTNLASINSTQLKGFPIACPGPAEQCQIIERTDRADRRVSLEASELQKLVALKSGLMDDLLTGRVRVTPLLEATAP